MRFAALVALFSTFCFYLPVEAQYWSDAPGASESIDEQTVEGSTGVSGLITPDEMGLDSAGEEAGSGVSGLIKPEEIGLPADRPAPAQVRSSPGGNQHMGQSPWIRPQQQTGGGGGTSITGQPGLEQQMQAPPGSYLRERAGQPQLQQPYRSGGQSYGQGQGMGQSQLIRPGQPQSGYIRQNYAGGSTGASQGMGQSQLIRPGQSQGGYSAPSYSAGSIGAGQRMGQSQLISPGQPVSSTPSGYSRPYGQSQVLTPGQIRQGAPGGTAGMGQSGLINADGQPVQNVQQSKQKRSRSTRKHSSRGRGLSNTVKRGLRRGLGRGTGGGIRGFGF